MPGTATPSRPVCKVLSDSKLSLSDTTLIETDPDLSGQATILRMLESEQDLNGYLAALEADTLPPVSEALLKKTKGIKKSPPLSDRDARRVSKRLSEDFS